LVDSEIQRRRAAASANLKIAPLSAYCIEEVLRGGLRLGSTAFNERLIKQSVKKLGRALNEIIPG
jgi:hypothetical protein